MIAQQWLGRSPLRAMALILVTTGCAGMLAQQSPDRIAPPQAFVSPNMDFTKLKKLGVFPLFPGSSALAAMGGAMGGVQDDAFAEEMVGALTAEVKTRQSQWTISDYREVVTLINKNGLGSGFRNLQADLNTSSLGIQGTVVLSEATKKFMSDMQRVAGVDAFLIGTYRLTREVRQVGTILTMNREVDVANVRWVLFSAREGTAWWSASVGRYGDRAGVIKEISQSLAANIGKGTLIQM